MMGVNDGPENKQLVDFVFLACASVLFVSVHGSVVLMMMLSEFTTNTNKRTGVVAIRPSIQALLQE